MKVTNWEQRIKAAIPIFFPHPRGFFEYFKNVVMTLIILTPQRLLLIVHVELFDISFLISHFLFANLILFIPLWNYNRKFWKLVKFQGSFKYWINTSVKGNVQLEKSLNGYYFRFFIRIYAWKLSNSIFWLWGIWKTNDMALFWDVVADSKEIFFIK